MQSIVLKWTNPTTDRDGNAYAQTDNAGYMASLDGAVPFPINLVWGTQYDIGTDVHLAQLKVGTHTVSIATKSTKGVVGSFTPAVSFSVFPVPAAPGNLSVA
jgi:hypothetical protein